MIVFDLKCRDGHIFEGWFASGDDFDQQRSHGLLNCPICGADEVAKSVMAPNVGRKGNQSPVLTQNKDGDTAPLRSDNTHGAGQVPVAAGNSAAQKSPTQNMAVTDPESVKKALTVLAKAQSEMLKSSEWVGGDFAKRARAMHYGEEDKQQIHGATSEEEAQDLLDEGIGVAPLPFPVVPPESQN